MNIELFTQNAEVNECSITEATNSVNKSSDEKVINFNKPNELSKNDIEQDKLYSSVFETVYYTEETIPIGSLPYGLICENGANTNAGDLEDWDCDGISFRVYTDCIKYITKQATAKDEFEWYHDFILFTNLQITVYNNFDIIAEGEALDLVVEYTAKNIRNLRSSVARNALLFVECLINKCPNKSSLFVNIFTKLIPKLFNCTASEKVVFREPAKQCLLLLCSKSASISNIEILWILFDSSYSKNMKISSFSALCVKEYTESMSDEDFMQIDLERLLPYLEHFADGKCIQMKEATNRIITRLLMVLSDERVELFITIGKGNPRTLAYLERLCPQRANMMP